jgi:hypothetical protein
MHRKQPVAGQCANVLMPPRESSAVVRQSLKDEI